MDGHEELQQKAREIRELAVRVRRIARGISLNADHYWQADDLEAEAEHPERRATKP